MHLPDTTFIGIDPTAGKKPFTFAALDMDCNLLALDSGEMEETLNLISKSVNAYVAVNGPRNPNIGLVKKENEKRGLRPGQMRGADLRLAEYLLREKGILISSTPSKKELCPEWTQLCFALYENLDELGFLPFPAENSPKQCLETHPHAAFSVMLEQQPLSKPTLEGRLQRQLVLHEANVGIKNPMEFFEEITSHRLIHGILPLDKVYFPEQLDAIAAAYVAYLAGHEPQRLSFIGSRDEGIIVLPTSKLLENYNSA